MQELQVDLKFIHEEKISNTANNYSQKDEV